MIRNIIGILLLISVTLPSCFMDKEEQLYPNSFAGNDTATYYYAKDIQPLISAKCAISGCHVAGAQIPDLSTYNGVSTNASKINTVAVVNRTMPKGGTLTGHEVNMLKNWIADGAQNN